MSSSQFISQIKVHAELNQYRHLVLITGTKDWGREQAVAFEQTLGIKPEQSLWCSDQIPLGRQQIFTKQAQQQLGTETDWLVYDAWQGFNPNAFAQLAGTLKGGGVLLLLCPELSAWQDFSDPEYKALRVDPYGLDEVGNAYLKRLSNFCADNTLISIIGPDKQQLADFHAAPPKSKYQAPYLSVEQEQKVAAIVRGLGRSRRPQVLNADRGRGKTACLGLIAKQMHTKGYKVYICAPERHAVNVAFAQSSTEELTYITVDEASQIKADNTLLLVDEAAAFPLPLLQRLLTHFTRIVFASTQQGYEGTGQGFALRFQPLLSQLAPAWQEHQLIEPIRWSMNDPLEQFVAQSLLLGQAEINTAKDIKQTPGSIEIEAAEQDYLAANETLLEQVMSLLVSAHYRTSPNDLRVFLDSPNVHIWLAKQNQEVVAVALVAFEAGLDTDLAEAVWQGKRRPQGQLLPQTLVSQEGYLPAAQLKAGRIMRIAVQPSLRRQKIASLLLDRVKQFAEQQSWDYLGTSFAMQHDLLCFWQQQNFKLLRIGVMRDKISGTYPALVSLPLSSAGQDMQKELRQQLANKIPLLLADQLQKIELKLLPNILQNLDLDARLKSTDLASLKNFSEAYPSYECCLLSLRKLALTLLQHPQLYPQCASAEENLLISKAVLLRSWSDLEQELGMGRKGLQQQLRDLVGQVIPLIGKNKA